MYCKWYSITRTENPNHCITSNTPAQSVPDLWDILQQNSAYTAVYRAIKQGSPASHRKKKSTGLVPAALGESFQPLNYTHHWGFLTCQLILLLSQMGLKKPNSQLFKQPPWRISLFSFLLYTAAWELRKSWGHYFSLGLTSCNEEEK